MRNITGGVCLAIGLASFVSGVVVRDRQDASRRDSLRVALTQLDDAYVRISTQDTITAGLAFDLARKADSLEFALHRTTIRVRLLVDTLRTFELPTGVGELLDSLSREVGRIQSYADSLWVTHNEEIRLYEVRLTQKDSLLMEYRRLSIAAVTTPSRKRTLVRDFAVGALLGMVAWEIVR